MLREVEQRLGIARRLADCIADPRPPERILPGLDDIIRFRMLMIAAGYEDGNDADSLRSDPLFKLAMDRLPEQAELCSQSTVSRCENLPDSRALLRMGRAMVDHYCQSFRQVPRRMIAAVLRPASRPTGRQIVAWLHRLIGALRTNCPRIEILLRTDSHDCTPAVLRFCRAKRLDYVLGVAPTTTLRKHITALEASTTERAARAGGEKLRLFLHIGAYWLMWSLRAAMPRRSFWRVAQFDTLRLRLIKLAARVEVLKRRVRLHLPSATADQAIFACALTRLPRMLT